MFTGLARALPGSQEMFTGYLGTPSGTRKSLRASDGSRIATTFWAPPQLTEEIAFLQTRLVFLTESTFSAAIGKDEVSRHATR
jgi:hypothetical protein